MAKKFIEFIEAAALIILTAACVIGVSKHLDSHKDEPKEETPIVEEVPEVLTLEIKVNGGEAFTIEFEEGMTWGEWLESDYNNALFYAEGNFIYSKVNEALVLGYEYYNEEDNYTDYIGVNQSELISLDLVYGVNP